MAERPRQGRLFRDSAWVFGGQLTMTVIGVGTSVILARVLGPHDRGLFALLTFFPVTLANFAKLGIPQANVYCIRRQGATAADVASNSLWLALGLGGAFGIGCWLCRDLLLRTVLKGAPPEALLPVVVLLPFVLLQVFFLGVLQAQERFREYNFQVVAPTVFNLVGMAVVLLWLRAGLMGAVLTHVSIMMLVTLVLAVRVRRRTHFGAGWNGGVARRMLNFGRKSYVQTLAATLHKSIDKYMIVMLLDPTAVGVYVIAANLTDVMLKVPQATGTVLFPRLAGLPDGDAHAETSRVTRYTVSLALVAAVGYLALGPIAIPLMYGREFAGAVLPMLLLLPGTVMMTLYLILSRNFTSRNRQEVNILAAGVALGVNVGLNLLLIPVWGISGAAVSSTVSYSLAALVLLLAFVRDSGHSISETLFVGRTDLGNLARFAFRARRATAE